VIKNQPDLNRPILGPTVWNSPPDQLRDSDCTESTFRQSLKTFFFNQCQRVAAHYRRYDYALHKSTFYLLTYFRQLL